MNNTITKFTRDGEWILDKDAEDVILVFQDRQMQMYQVRIKINEINDFLDDYNE